ncbi:methyltransferase domain-containing protein [Aeoliella mucimassa]|uniref:Trans-aconitate 2-methyltransferase n=1 Tax=Aeoliella mucimassa TaxID=2527972 RepID=A0A518AP92_9BACT|nr:methyltransferase domain-containing protein [Aeoliella mucimassa]QDU56532.1 hypothetical protein Pan181_27420 [Aeoliella mucimassa]
MSSVSKSVKSYDSSDPAYYDAFRVFLEHTNQKQNAMQWLEQAVSKLSQRRVLIDAGAGNGTLTQWLLESFDSGIGIEPNESLFNELAPLCGRSHQVTIMDSEPEAIGDLVLCSHVFYYIPKSEWSSNLQRLLSWLDDEGVLVLALQNPRTDCMQMVQHFLGDSFDISQLVPMLNDMEGGPYRAELERVQATIHANDLETACQIAEFVLNVLPVPEGLPWGDLEKYVEERFADLDGGYSFSCHQDFLKIQRQ